MSIKGDEEVTAAITSVAEYQVSTGMKSLEPSDIDEHEIDERHLLVKLTVARQVREDGR